MPDSEYIFEVDVPSDVENFSNINTDTNPFEVSVKMKAAGNILSNLDARESLYSNAMTNDATLGIFSEFIYDEGAAHLALVPGNFSLPSGTEKRCPW